MKEEIKQLINESGLSDKDRLTIKFLAESIEKKKINEFTDKTFLFEGNPGIGKTYFVEHLIKLLDLPVLFVGPFKFDYKNAKHFKDLKTLKNALMEKEECVVFIDDIQNAIKVERDGMGEIHLSDSEGKNFVSILEHIKRSKSAKYMFLTLNDNSIIEESWLDRIETRITLEHPKEKSKKDYLAKKYSQYINKGLTNELAEKTMGYNFRNLDELIRISYRKGNGKINKLSIKQALQSYTPTSLEEYNIIHDTKVKFKDVIGKNEVKNQLKHIRLYLNKPKFFSANEIKKNNILLFSGPPGTGKTLMVKAIAGELGLPLVNIDGDQLFRRGGIKKAFSIARRFKNCVVFIDELDKLIGRDILAEDDATIGAFEDQLDGMKGELKSILIFAMNNRARFGQAFHDRMNTIIFSYPDENDREEFFKRRIEKSNISINDEDMKRLVSLSKNLSFRKIERIWNNIVLNIVEKHDFKFEGNTLSTNKEEVSQAIEEVFGFVYAARPALGVG